MNFGDKIGICNACGRPTVEVMRDGHYDHCPHARKREAPAPLEPETAGRVSDRLKALDAARMILGAEVFDAMTNASFSPVRIMNAAALKAFEDDLSGSHVEDLRRGLKSLDTLLSSSG